jgi:hypothetical protein
MHALLTISMSIACVPEIGSSWLSRRNGRAHMKNGNLCIRLLAALGLNVAHSKKRGRHVLLLLWFSWFPSLTHSAFWLGFNVFRVLKTKCHPLHSISSDRIYRPLWQAGAKFECPLSAATLSRSSRRMNYLCLLGSSDSFGFFQEVMELFCCVTCKSERRRKSVAVIICALSHIPISVYLLGNPIPFINLY